MSDIHLEQYSPGTVSADRTLAVLLRSAPGFSPPLDQQLDLAAYAVKISNLAELIFAVQDANDLGLAALYANDQSGRCAFLTMLAIIPERKGAHLGTALLQRVITVAGERGMQSIRLEVAETNRDAQRLYAKFGFVLVPRPCSTNGRQTTSIVLERSCNPLPPNR
jgi:ribosomal protein S18 acetylase RimI-like enzyme